MANLAALKVHMGFPFCLVTMEPLFFDADNWPLRSPKDASELILPAVGVKLEVFRCTKTDYSL